MCSHPHLLTLVSALLILFSSKYWFHLIMFLEAQRSLQMCSRTQGPSGNKRLLFLGGCAFSSLGIRGKHVGALVGGQKHGQWPHCLSHSGIAEYWENNLNHILSQVSSFWKLDICFQAWYQPKRGEGRDFSETTSRRRKYKLLLSGGNRDGLWG